MNNNEIIKISKKEINRLQRKTNRDLELEQGRQSYNRVHKSKVAYKREKYKKVILDEY
jgi:hypothetical protein